FGAKRSRLTMSSNDPGTVLVLHNDSSYSKEFNLHRCMLVKGDGTFVFTSSSRLWWRSGARERPSVNSMYSLRTFIKPHESIVCVSLASASDAINRARTYCLTQHGVGWTMRLDVERA